MTTTPPDAADALQQEHVEDRVVAIVRELAYELGGDRSASAVTATSSLERDVGLGSLERVELLMRLKGEFQRELDDRFLLLDSVRDVARAIPDAPAAMTAPRVRWASHGTATSIRVDRATTLVEALRQRAEAEPTRVHVNLYTDAGIQPLTYAALWDGASRIATSLRARGVRRGDTIAIMLPTSVDYLQAFMGIVAAGGVAVPLYPPARLDRLSEYLQRQARILVNAGSRLMIAMPEAVPVTRLLNRSAPALESIVTASELRDTTDADVACSGVGSDVALIQYTSGSTGDPKGVVLTHANLLANIRAIVEGVQLAPTDVGVSWLPLYHDMGLIGAWLTLMVNGNPVTLMSPLTFLAQPERWLWAIHQQRATITAAPNFAYELCVRRIRDDALAGLDLSSMRHALNGSEPVNAASLERFAARFGPYGFRREAMYPVYGLAESSVALCFPPVGRAPLTDVIGREAFARDGLAVNVARDGAAPLEFVSVGRPLPGHEVRLVNADGSDVPERTVGRLVFRGPSVTAGYHENPDATARAMLPGGWVDSGDLAYRASMAGGEELFVTGRAKDLIIKAGRNIVPQEIEEIVGAVDGIRKGCVAAFGVPDEATGTERLIVIAESRTESEQERFRLERAAVANVAAALGVPPDVVRIVPPGSVPKTPSGKIRRRDARAAFLSGAISGPPQTPVRVRVGLVAGVAVQGMRRALAAMQRGVEVVSMVVAAAVLLLLLGPALAVLACVLPQGRPMRRLARVMARLVVGATGSRVLVEGADHLAMSGPLVLVSNHTSYADATVLLAALPRDFVFVAMRELLAWPVIGALTRRCRHLTVDRWQVHQSVADTVAIEQRLREQNAVLFFAEGGFVETRGLRPFRLGAFQAAVAAGAPVVPVALRGCREVLPSGARLPHARRVRVWIGEPLHAAGTDWKAVVDLRNRTAEAVAAHCGEPRLEGITRS